MTKQSFDNAKKTHRVALAIKPRDRASVGRYAIPATVDAATKVEAVKAAAAHKRSQRTNHRTN